MRTSVHLGMARLVRLDPLGERVVMIKLAIAAFEDAPDRLAAVISSCDPHRYSATAVDIPTTPSKTR